MRLRENPNLFRNNLVLLTSLVILIVLLPLFTIQKTLILHILLIFVIVSGTFSLEFRDKKRRYLIFFGSLTIIGGVLDFFWINDFIKLTFHTSFFIFNIAITFFIIGHIARKKEVTIHLIVSSVNGYLLLGVLGSFLLYMTEIIHRLIYSDGTFAIKFPGVNGPTFHDFIYFSFVTLTTLGYGDVTPASSLAKSACLAISTMGQLYLTILVAMIVGKYLNRQNG